MNRLIAMAFVLACTACAPVTTRITAADVAKSGSVAVIDTRPTSEKEHKFFSLLITSKEYGIIRIGDAKLSPSPISLMQYQIYTKFNGTGYRPKVTVYHFVIYLNADVQLRASAGRMYGSGLLSSLMINKATEYSTLNGSGLVNEKAFDNLADDEYQRGLYSAAENSSGTAVYIVYVDTDIDGKKVFTRTISPVEKQESKNSLAEVVQLAIKNQLAYYDVPVTSPSAPTADVSQTAHTPSSAEPALAGARVLTSSTNAAATSMAQTTATQMGCGAVQNNGDSTFTAPCGSYSVLIGCSDAQCRPLHTISIKEM